MPPKVTRQSPNGPARPSGPENVLDRIAPIDFGEEGIKMLLYGRSGTGKTTFWATFPDPILAVVCSGGTKPGELRSIDTPANRQRIRQVTLEHSSELLTVADHVQAAGGYRTVVLDHCSGLQDLTLKEILGLEELPAQKSWGMASQQQYGQSSLQCKELLRRLLNLSCNVVLIAQERTFGDDTGSEVIQPTVGPALTPSVVGWLCPAVEYLCETFIRPRMAEATVKIGGKDKPTRVRGKGVEYCLRLEPHDVFMTKFRVPKGTPLPDVIVDPDYDKVAQLLRGVR